MTVAVILVSIVAVAGFGGLLFDAVIPATACQHLWNPNWSPHAKLHNGQTMLLGIANGALTLVVLFGMRPLTPPLMLFAIALASAYWIAMLLASAFPGTGWCDPEFQAGTPRPLGFHPQQLVSLVLLGLLALALILAITSAGSA